LGLLRFCSLIVISSFIWPFVYVEKVHSEQKNPFYNDFLVQRMMIAKIRELRGDATARTLLQGLVKEAERIGMKIPAWSHSRPLKVSVKYDFHADRRKDSERYDPLIYKASRVYELPPALIKAVVHAESAFVKDAVSKKGAQGLMQLMPDTANEIDVLNPFDPKANILGGSRLLKKYLTDFGSLKQALIAYNAGPDWVRKKKGIPRETRRYIRNVIRYYRMYRREM